VSQKNPPLTFSDIFPKRSSGGGGLTHIVHSVPLPGRARGWMLTNEPTNQRTNEPTNMIDHNTSWRI